MHIRPCGQSVQERRTTGAADEAPEAEAAEVETGEALGVLAEAMDGAWTSAVPAARTRTAGVMRIGGIGDLPLVFSLYPFNYSL
ncbi:hypothetical protein GCM10010187_61330 [Actinomadura coerulea]|nr:hypothetical protein GCM10010187_61330 [Actinomadura coerulea]